MEPGRWVPSRDRVAKVRCDCVREVGWRRINKSYVHSLARFVRLKTNLTKMPPNLFGRIEMMDTISEMDRMDWAS